MADMPTSGDEKVETTKNETVAPMPARSSRRVVLFLLAIFLAFVGYRIQPQRIKQLPESYTLCTPNGNLVHLVDKANSQVACISVDGSRIVDIGSLSKF